MRETDFIEEVDVTEDDVIVDYCHYCGLPVVEGKEYYCLNLNKERYVDGEITVLRSRTVSMFCNEQCMILYFLKT